MITVQLNGVNYTNFTSINVTKNIESVSGSFAFSSTADSQNLFPIRMGDLVKIYVDGEKILTGYVEKLSVNYDDTSHSIEASGRNILCDLIDSTVGTTKEYEGEVSIIDIARSVLDGIGLQSVKVINQVGELESFKPWDIESAEVGEKCFEFIEKFARKKQFFWNSDADGNLLLLRASQELLPYKLVARVNGDGNNIKTAYVAIDHTNRYNQYKAQGNLNLSGIRIPPKEAVEQEGQAVRDTAIRGSRILEFNAEENSDSFTATDRAIWESNIRIARSLSYSAVVQGHSVGGMVWPVNALVDVDDEIANIKDQLFIKSVIFSQSNIDGTTTRLNMTYRNAFQLEAEQKARQTKEETLI
jgi:prophage tail gpP-like protein